MTALPSCIAHRGAGALSERCRWTIPISARAFDHLIRLLADSLGLTVFLVTHDLDTLFSIIDRVIVLSNGRVLGSGTVEALKHIDDPWLRDYVAARASQEETAHGS